MYQISVYIPLPALEKVRDAMFEAGGGSFGFYDSCCWITKGKGRFRPLHGSNPYLGERGNVEEVDEYKLEMSCDDKVFESVIKAMKKAHPYETPAFNYFHFNENI